MKNKEFITGKVPITKEEVRAISISSLELEKAEKMIDIGAGTGSISIEAALKHPNLSVTAIERNDDALELIEKNKEKFDLNNIEIVKGYAPIELKEKYDAVFIGGTGKKLDEILDWVYEIINDGGRVCANFIIIDTFNKAVKAFKEKGFKDIDVSMVSVSKLEKLGSGEFFKPNNPVFVISCRKGN